MGETVAREKREREEPRERDGRELRREREGLGVERRRERKNPRTTAQLGVLCYVLK